MAWTANGDVQHQLFDSSKVLLFLFYMETIKGYWRRTRLGAISHPIAIRLEGNRLSIVEPIRKEFSRSGHHGIFVYPNNVDVLLHLEQTNSGHRSVLLTRCSLATTICEYIRETVEMLWLSGASTPHVEKALSLLTLPSPPQS